MESREITFEEKLCRDELVDLLQKHLDAEILANISNNYDIIQPIDSTKNCAEAMELDRFFSISKFNN